MKICWDTIEGFVLSKKGNLINKQTNKYCYFKNCKGCGEEFFAYNKKQKFCSLVCSSSGKNNGMFGKKSNGRAGLPHTEETKLKMKEAQLGKKNHFYGKKHTDETKKKISDNHGTKYEWVRDKISNSLKGKLIGENNPFYGKYHTDETKKKISDSHKKDGKFKLENNPNWRGGLSFKGYCPIFFSKEFKFIILHRDASKCMNPQCSHITNKLCVHHIDYDKKNCRENNLITLCKQCNIRANYNKEYWVKYYKQKIKESYNV